MGGSSHRPREPEAQGQYRGGVPERLTQSQGMDFPIIGCRCPFITRMAQWGFSRKRFSIQPNWCNHLHFPLSQGCFPAMFNRCLMARGCCVDISAGPVP